MSDPPISRGFRGAFLKPLAPIQSEPPFIIAQAAAMVLFVVLGALAVIKFRPGLPKPHNRHLPPRREPSQD